MLDQVGLLVTLLLLAIGLIAVIGYLVYRITIFRKEQVSDVIRPPVPPIRSMLHHQANLSTVYLS